MKVATFVQLIVIISYSLLLLHFSIASGTAASDITEEEFADGERRQQSLFEDVRRKLDQQLLAYQQLKCDEANNENVDDNDEQNLLNKKRIEERLLAWKKSAQLAVTKSRLWLGLLEELDIYWRERQLQNANDERPNIDGKIFEEFVTTKMRIFLEKLDKFSKEFQRACGFGKGCTNGESAKAFVEMPNFGELLISDERKFIIDILPNAELQGKWSKISKLRDKRKGEIAILMQVKYAIHRMNKKPEEAEIEYPELAQSIDYAKSARGLNPCDDFHKFVCSGFHRLATEHPKYGQQLAVGHATFTDDNTFEKIEETFEELLLARKNTAKSATNANGGGEGAASNFNHSNLLEKGEIANEKDGQKMSVGEHEKTESKCVGQMLTFYEKCLELPPMRGKKSKVDSELEEAQKFGELKRILQGEDGILAAEVKMENFLGKDDKIVGLNSMLDATFPFTPFFQFERADHLKDKEMVVLKPRQPLHMKAATKTEATAGTTTTASSSGRRQKGNDDDVRGKTLATMLKLLCKHGLLGAVNGDNAQQLVQDGSKDYGTDEQLLVEEIIRIDQFIANQTAENAASNLFLLGFFKQYRLPALDLATLLRDKWPDFRPKISGRTFIQVENVKFFQAVVAKMAVLNAKGTLVERRAMAEYMRLSTFWPLVMELDTRSIGELLKKSPERTPGKCPHNYVNTYFPHCLEHLMAHQELGNERTRLEYQAKHRVAQQMFDRVKRGFLAFLRDSSSQWMGKIVRGNALKKIGNVRAQIGYPDWLVENRGDLLYQKYYPGLELSPQMSWLEMVARLQRVAAPWQAKKGAQMFGEYYEHTNSLIINRGQMESPDMLLLKFVEAKGSLKASGPMAFNMGALGSIMAHELAHALDPNSINKNSNGKIPTTSIVDGYMKKTIGIAPSTILTKYKYNKQIQCLQKQYANFWITKDRMDPEKTLREDYADNMGMQASHRAFEIAQNDDNGDNSQVDIYGLGNYDRKQLFFIGYAYNQCYKLIPKGQHIWAQHSYHSLPSARVNVPLLNLPAFAQAFQCPVGSAMNPVKGGEEGNNKCF